MLNLSVIKLKLIGSVFVKGEWKDLSLDIDIKLLKYVDILTNDGKDGAVKVFCLILCLFLSLNERWNILDIDWWRVQINKAK